MTLSALLKRIKDACRTNEPQILGLLVCSAPCVTVCLQKEAYGLAVLVLLGWIGLIFLLNFIDPLPKD